MNSNDSDPISSKEGGVNMLPSAAGGVNLLSSVAGGVNMLSSVAGEPQEADENIEANAKPSPAIQPNA